MKNSLYFITRAALIAALYFCLSIAFEAIAFGPIQFRVSEALVLLPILMPAAIPGLAIGCFFTNFFLSPFGIYDMLFGTIATLIGAILTYCLRRNILLSALPPMILNALLIPLIWIVDGTSTIYIITALQIFASEAIICGAIGIPFTLTLKKTLVRAHLIDLTEGKFSKTTVYHREPCMAETKNPETIENSETTEIFESVENSETIKQSESPESHDISS